MYNEDQQIIVVPESLQLRKCRGGGFTLLIYIYAIILYDDALLFLIGLVPRPAYTRTPASRCTPASPASPGCKSESDGRWVGVTKKKKKKKKKKKFLETIGTRRMLQGLRVECYE